VLSEVSLLSVQIYQRLLNRSVIVEW